MTDNKTMKVASENTCNKIKAIYPHITVSGDVDKPYYNIDWYDIEKQEMYRGYSSYNLQFVRKWLEEEFEVVEEDTDNIIKRQQAEIEELQILTGLMRKRTYYNKFVKEVFQKEKGSNLVYPDADVIYKRYFEQQAEIERYKDLEEQGRLIELPCKVGDTVWCIEDDEGYADHSGYLFMGVCSDYVIVCTHYYHCGDDFQGQLNEMCEESLESQGIDLYIFHKDDVFLTEEEAEAKLKEW